MFPLRASEEPHVIDVTHCKLLEGTASLERFASSKAIGDDQ